MEPGKDLSASVVSDDHKEIDTRSRPSGDPGEIARVLCAQHDVVETQCDH